MNASNSHRRHPHIYLGQTCPVLSRLMRMVLALAGVLVIGIGLPLLFFPEDTRRYFPFPIEPSATAAFLGANYLAAGVLQLLTARQRCWHDAAPAVPAVFAFTVITAAITALNFSSFDLRHMPTLIWIAVYFTFPLLQIVAWSLQPGPWLGRRAETQDGCLHALPATCLTAFGLALLVLGAAFLTLPAAAAGVWAWSLAPKNAYGGAAGLAPYVGAWLVGLGIAAMHTGLLRRANAARATLRSAVVLCTLQGVSLWRAWDAEGFTSLGAALYIAALVLLGVLGVAGARSCKNARP